MKKLALVLLGLLGCGPNSGNANLEPMEGEVGRCIFRYPNGSNTSTQVYDEVVGAELDPFNPEAITLTFSDGTTAVINGFGSVHCYPYQHAPTTE